MQKDLIILGIDPGTNSTGYGLIKCSSQNQVALDFGCVRPPSKLSLSKRYLIIFESIEKLIKANKPDVIAVETQFVKKNVQSAMKLGMVRGIIMLAAEKNQIPIFEYAPKKAKLAVTGSGNATKEQVQRMIQLLLNLPSLPKPEDAADALALAITHAHLVSKSSLGLYFSKK